MARPTKQPHERRSERFNLRFTVAELAHIEQQAQSAGIDPTEYLRRRALGYEVPPAPRRADASLVSELNRVGQNVNQIARNLNSGRRERLKLDLVLAELRGVLEKVVASYGA
ncbi:MAG: plasmid mobilization relaxosome protein MobC [Planctomycetota bacterium]